MGSTNCGRSYLNASGTAKSAVRLFSCPAGPPPHVRSRFPLFRSAVDVFRCRSLDLTEGSTDHREAVERRAMRPSLFSDQNMKCEIALFAEFFANKKL